MPDIYDKLLSKLKVIQSKAWLVSRYDEDRSGKIKPKITPRYFGVITLKGNKIYYQGSFMRLKKINLVIPLGNILQINIFAGRHLRIKWIGRDRIIHNAMFLIGELHEFNIAYPSKNAAEVWFNLITRALQRMEKKK